MRKGMKWICGAAVILMMAACNTRPADEWQLVWEENFDTTNWSKIPRWAPEWAKYMSDSELCYDLVDGNLVLKGLINPDRSTDTVPYITGGIYTKYKRAFHGGRLEIKAQLGCATGAWPAIWLKPFEEAKYPWPSGGEIDIMEHLNYDSIAYQTVHSTYTHNLNIKKDRIETDKEGQFPFDKPYYLLIDMQLGGPWVGPVNPEDLPVEMKVDWVRYYQKKK